ncbi:tRNA (adenine(37)-N6)-methyltransferase [Diplonema papillatum]|nr:tRNA (adenine(37)-N6)-methyltransferase [Diplonema papillatum]|eukprot:gene11639-17949_t
MRPPSTAAAVALVATPCVAAVVSLWCLALSRREVRKLRELQAAERAGRLKAEKRAARQHAADGRYSVTPVGVIRTAFADRNGTPRQPGLIESARAVLQVELISSSCLTGLEGYSHVWVLFWFHRNTNAAKAPADLKTLVAPPRGRGEKVGYFACRSPHRPNPIGLSLARILNVDHAQNSVTVESLDCVDGTPLIDIKPFLPPVERPEECFLPPWVASSYDQRQWEDYNITFAAGVVEDLEDLANAGLKKSCTDLRQLVVDTLSIDFRNVRHKQLTVFDGSLRLRNVEIFYTIDDTTSAIRVTRTAKRSPTSADPPETD